MSPTQTESGSGPMMTHSFPRSTSTKERLKRLYEVVRPEDRLAIVISADPDAIGSAMALKRLVWRRVKSSTVFNNKPIKRGDNLTLVRYLGMQLAPIRDLDASAFSRFAIVDSQPHHSTQFEKFKFDIIVDHHPEKEKFQAAFADIRPEYGATSTIFTEYLKAARIRPSSRLATALFYGIKTDTLNFVRGGIQSDMIAFRYLFPLANTNMLQKIEGSEITKSSLAYYRKGMQNLKLWKHTAYAHLGRIGNADACVQLADFFLKLAEVSYSMVSAVVGHRLVVVLRSDGYRRNAGQFAEKLFGKWGDAGGHKTMARAEVLMKDLAPVLKDEDQVEKFVFDLIRRHS